MSEPPRLWLHVGPAKTGSTSIQRTFRQNADFLRGRGVEYPAVRGDAWGRSRNNHNALSRALRGNDHAFVSAEIAALPPAPDTVLSSESLPGASPDQLSWLGDLLGRDHLLRVIYYMRDPIDHAVSSAGQAVKGGRTTYAAIVARPDPRPLFRKQITRLTRAFGTNRLDVRAFSRGAFTGGSLIADFSHAIARPGLLDGREIAHSTGAITMEDIPYLEARHGHRVLTDAQTAAADSSGTTPFTLPRAYLDRLRANCTDDLDWLAETHGIDFRVKPDASDAP